jgi:hypothetical protein
MIEFDEIVRMGEKQVEKFSLVNLAQKANEFTRLAGLQQR